MKTFKSQSYLDYGNLMRICSLHMAGHDSELAFPTVELTFYFIKLKSGIVFTPIKT